MNCDAVLIAGPTAGGKSAAALALAEAIGGSIVNADSMQVYAQARILTARPDAADEQRVPHLLYGHVSVHEPYSVGRYQDDAGAAIGRVRAQGRVPVLCGGTGMYFGALVDGIADVPPVPADIREEVRARRAAIGADAFHAELAKLDPAIASRLRASDTQRTLRAYEVVKATGCSLLAWQQEMGAPVLGGMKLARFVLSPPRDVLHARIDARFDRMMEMGAMDEALRLRDIAPSLSAAKILGRRELIAAHDGEISLADAVSRAKAATRQYAKRQLTWFRNRMADWIWIEGLNDNILSAMRQNFA